MLKFEIEIMMKEEKFRRKFLFLFFRLGEPITLTLSRRLSPASYGIGAVQRVGLYSSFVGRFCIRNGAIALKKKKKKKIRRYERRKHE